MIEYLGMLKKSLDANGFRYYDAGRQVHKVAVVGGSGGDEFHHAIRHNCDTFVTSDIKYSIFLEAMELGVNLIDGGHFCTENVVVGALAGKLRSAFQDVQVFVSKRHKQVVEFFA